MTPGIAVMVKPREWHMGFKYMRMRLLFSSSSSSSHLGWSLHRLNEHQPRAGRAPSWGCRGASPAPWSLASSGESRQPQADKRLRSLRPCPGNGNGADIQGRARPELMRGLLGWLLPPTGLVS